MRPADVFLFFLGFFYSYREQGFGFPLFSTSLAQLRVLGGSSSLLAVAGALGDSLLLNLKYWIKCFDCVHCENHLHGTLLLSVEVSGEHVILIMMVMGGMQSAIAMRIYITANRRSGPFW